MRRAKPPLTRNKIDLADTVQIRILKRRLGISAEELQQIVAKVGNSIAGISKEVELKRMPSETEPGAVKKSQRNSGLTSTHPRTM